MSFKNKFIKSSLLLGLSIFLLTGCEKSNENFDPPNKTNIQTGTAPKLVKPSTGLSAKANADKMAKLWDKEAVLVYINGTSIGSDGFNMPENASSQWIFTYVSPQKKKMGYEIVFKGDGQVTWLETDSSYTSDRNIENLSLDTDKVITKVEGSGEKSEGGYTLETLSKDKQITWFIGIKKGSKTDIKKIDNLTGEFVN